MTRPLTDSELDDAKVAYLRLGRMRWMSDTYHLHMILPQIADAVMHGSTNGKPLPPEPRWRPATAADAGKPCRVVTCGGDMLQCPRLIGTLSDGMFVVETNYKNVIHGWKCEVQE